MKSIVRRRTNVKLIVTVFTLLLSIAALMLSRLSANAANTFPHQYDLITINNVDGQGVDRSAKIGGVNFDGSKVLFGSPATNLPQSTATSTAQTWAGYMRDMRTSTTTRIDLSASGVVPDQSTMNHVMNITGRYVAFSSSATNLVDGSLQDTSVSRIYLKDLSTGTVQLIVNTPYSVVNGYPTWSMPLTVSDDGRFVTIVTNRISSLIPGTRSGNGGGYQDLAMYDRQASTWSLINKPINGGALQNIDSGAGYTGQGYINANCDGSLIVFESPATNLVSNYSGSGRHVYLADARNGLNITDITAGAIADSTVPDISCNGRYITYSTKDRTLIAPTPSGMNSAPHLVRYDRFTGERIYIDSNSNNTTYNPSQLDGMRDDYTSSVGDQGDVVLPYASTSIMGVYRTTVQFKHLSDGSGTLENVQHNPAGLKYESNYVSLLTPDGKYVIIGTQDGYTLGLFSNNYTNGPFNIVRVKTGL